MPEKKNGINVNIKINFNGLAKAVLIYCGYKIISKSMFKKKPNRLNKVLDKFFVDEEEK